jgi:hypothetical protein
MTVNLRHAASATTGTLAVSTSPVLPSQISVNGVPRNREGAIWGLPLVPGSYTVSFTHVPGYAEPASQTVTVTAGQTTSVIGTFTPLATLRVTTNPPLGGVITVDSVDRDTWGLYLDLPAGTHTIAWGPVNGYTAPASQQVTLTAGVTTTAVGSYTKPSPGTDLATWGVFTDAFPLSTTRLNQISTAVGRSEGIRHWYVQAASPWSDWPNWGLPGIQASIAAGKTPLVTWEMWADASLQPGTYWPLNDITAGVHDAYLTSWAQGIKALTPNLVYLRILHEQNLIGQYPWTVYPGNPFGNTPAQYVAAWQHVVNLFRAQGVTNVRWVFNVGGDLTNNPLPAGTYPGDAYVDYVGADMYDTAPVGSVALDAPLIRAIAPSKPVLDGEVGGSAAWVSSELSPYAHASHVSVVWFDAAPSALGTSNEAAVKTMLVGLP